VAREANQTGARHEAPYQVSHTLVTEAFIAATLTTESPIVVGQVNGKFI
jgi:hypothetical protein